MSHSTSQFTPTLDDLSRRAWHSRRARAVIAAVLFLPTATGCYSNQLIASERAAPGSLVSFAINDRGRVGLSDRMGPGVISLSGRLTNATDSVYMLSVSSVEFLNTGSARWSGEQVRVPREYVGSMSERKLSRKRSWLVAAIVTGGLVALALAASLIAGGTESNPGDNGGHDGQS